LKELGVLDAYTDLNSLTDRCASSNGRSSVGQGTPKADGDYIPEADGDPTDGDDDIDLEEEATDQANEVHLFVEISHAIS
jgi:hypothetical protein